MYVKQHSLVKRQRGKLALCASGCICRTFLETLYRIPKSWDIQRHRIPNTQKHQLFSCILYIMFAKVSLFVIRDTYYTARALLFQSFLNIPFLFSSYSSYSSFFPFGFERIHEFFFFFKLCMYSLFLDGFRF